MFYFRQDTETFYLQGRNISYIFRIDEYGFLRHLWYGKKMRVQEELAYAFPERDRGFSPNFAGAKNRAASLDTFTNEYPCAGLGDYRRPACLIRTADGARQADFRYRSYDLLPKTPQGGLPSLRGGETLCIHMSDDRYHLLLDLYYTVWDDSDAVVRSARITNAGAEHIFIERFSSFSLDLEDPDWRLLRLYGRPCAERGTVWAECAPGITELSSGMRGSSSHYLNPFLALKRANTDERTGEAYGVNLVYSGAFSLTAEYTQYRTLRLQGGIDDFGFLWKLESGESLCSPEAVLVYAEEGLGQMSRTFHALYRDRLIGERFARRPRPVLLNSWEAVHFSYDRKKLCALASLAAEAGMEMFVLDDGWFENRNSDCGGLGDWKEDCEKLDGGLRALSADCRRLGLKFGLWFEPEMTSETSRLYAEHPDWVLKPPMGEPVRGRDELVLDFCNPAVVEEIFRKMASVIRENNVSYIKWDMNRYLADLYSPYLPADRQGEVQHRYVLGVYALADRLQTAFPELLMEGCSGGGGRFDAGMLAYFPQIWASDNTDAYANAEIRYGTSMCYPPACMSAHVSICPNQHTGRSVSEETRYRVCSSAVLGYELDLEAVSALERESIRRQIAEYKEDRSLVFEGEFYRLSDPERDGSFIVESVSQDKRLAYVSGVAGLNEANAPVRRLRLAGLDADTLYLIRETGEKISGNLAMTVGLVLPEAEGDFAPIGYHLSACRAQENGKLGIRLQLCGKGDKP